MRAKFFWVALLLVAVLGIATAASASTSGSATGKQVAPQSINARDVVGHAPMLARIREAAAGSPRFLAVVNPLEQLPGGAGVGLIDCTSSSWCVGVGLDHNDQPLVLVGDPTTWSAADVHDIHLEEESFGSFASFDVVECTSSISCVAVGYDGHDQPFVLAGDPTTWSAADAKEITLGRDFGAGYLGAWVGGGYLYSVACSSSTSCVAVGSDGNDQPLIVAGDPATWSAANAREITLGSNGSLSLVKCTSPTSCFAVGGDENGMLIVDGDPATWSAANTKEIDLGNLWSDLGYSITCMSSTSCVAVGLVFEQNAYKLVVVAGNPATWKASLARKITLPNTLDSGEGLPFLESIACTSSVSCVAVGMDGNAQPMMVVGNPATWSAAAVREISLGKSWPGSGGAMWSVVCTSSTSCFAIGDDGNHGQSFVLAGDPATWSAADVKQIALTGPKFGVETESTTLACPSDSSCFALASYARGGTGYEKSDKARMYLVRGGPLTWDHASVAFIPYQSHIFDMTCASAQQCVAVGQVGDVEPDSGSDWWHESIALAGNPSFWGAKAPKRITLGRELDSLRSIACTSPTRCVAVGRAAREHPRDVWHYQPIVLTGDPAKWNAGHVRQITLGARFHSGGTLTSVACTSPTHCVAVGADGNGQPIVLVGNPSSWSARNAKQITLGKSLGGAGSLSSVACPSSGYCVSVGQAGTAATPLVLAGNPATWSTKSVFVLRVPAPQATSAEGLSTEPEKGTGSLISISCRSKTYCVAVGGDNHAAPLFITGDPSKWKGQLMSRPAKQGASFTKAALTSAYCTRKTCFVGGYSNGGDFVATLK